ncbi:hypothetical protein [Acinetobacter oleivorans]|uniref:hypothetical protein n=1 Tax=Acinetobacter oleivorans TaxID=1148157 RepID=UPI00124FBD37|nr:hypothetical protein [Acinetobacter oleivorans]
MNKFLYSLLVLTGLFFTCLAVSIAIKKFFDIDGDYLSAFATLAAAGVALYLYNDWKEPYKLEKVRDEQKEIRVEVRVLKKNIESLLYFFTNKSNSSIRLNNGDNFSLEFQNLTRSAMDSIDDLASLIANYKINFEKSEDQFIKDHLVLLTEAYKVCEHIHSIFIKHDIIYGYINAFTYIEKNLPTENNINKIRLLTEKLPEGMSTFYSELIKLKKGI